MPQEATDFLRKHPERPAAMKGWERKVVVQQCMIDDAFYGRPCVLK